MSAENHKIKKRQAATHAEVVLLIDWLRGNKDRLATTRTSAPALAKEASQALGFHVGTKTITTLSKLPSVGVTWVYAKGNAAGEKNPFFGKVASTMAELSEEMEWAHGELKALSCRVAALESALKTGGHKH